MSKERTCNIGVRCIICQGIGTVEVDFKDYISWKNGELIQKAMPYLSPGERELLISQVCSDCFDSVTYEG